MTPKKFFKKINGVATRFIYPVNACQPSSVNKWRNDAKFTSQKVIGIPLKITADSAFKGVNFKRCRNLGSFIAKTQKAAKIKFKRLEYYYKTSKNQSVYPASRQRQQMT